MNFSDLATSRYTTKKYNSELKISEDKIQQLKEILRMSPSSINSQPWNFVFVSDPEVKNTLAEASLFNENRVKNASHLVVFRVVSDIERFEEQILKKLSEGSVAYYDQMLKSQPEAILTSWFARQVYLSLGFFLSACAAMGIDSTPMEGIDAARYDEVLQLDGYKTLFAVAIGYRDAADDNQPSTTPKSRLDLADVVKTI